MKKQSIAKILLTILISVMEANAFAYDFAVENADGVTIYYNYINDGKELAVTYRNNQYNSYEGNVVIPEEVTYMNRTRKVTSIGNSAFYGCRSLTSVTIPNSVTSIGISAFNGCRGLTSVTIPNSVTSIGSGAFYQCYGLTSVTIGNSVTSIGDSAFYGCSGLTSVTIPNSVTSIGERTFYECDRLTSFTIPNSVTSIGDSAFYGCIGLTSVTIGNSVTSIGERTFYECGRLTSATIGNSVTSIGNYAFFKSGLTSVAIPNSVTSIGNYAFSGCSSLISVNIGNSVTSIGSEAFYGCSGLTSVTIPNSVTSIGSWAFYGCRGLISVIIGNSVTSIGNHVFDYADIPTVISLIENPFIIKGRSSDSRVFSTNTFNNATLYVPKGTIDKYKSTEGWKDFLFIEEGTGPNGGGETPETKKCAKPTIGYRNGKLTFNCETEGATCQYTITNDDIKSGSANEIQLGVTYRISVYATKDSYENSDVATATLCWIDVEPKTEGITNGVANVRALPLLIQTNGSTLTVSGADDGTPITIYSINGTEAGSALIQNGVATISTTLQSGSAAIVKIGDKSIKVVIK